MKLYKVIKDNKSCHGGDFDWSEHLPRGGKPGKWTKRIRGITECKRGYHVTPYWNMWHEGGCEVYECETKGLVVNSSPGVIDKYVCESVRLLRRIRPAFDNRRNTGYWNTGYWNTGDCNTGDFNTGNRNTGNHNTGNRNTGNRNTGNHNTGYWNTGDCNTGYWNTGYHNTGNHNTGNRNTGNHNTGDWNTGDCNTGSFNTGKPRYIELFNKPIKTEVYNGINFPKWFFFDIGEDYKGSWLKAFDGAAPREVEAATNLPNFDYDVFEEITGISETMINNKIKDHK